MSSISGNLCIQLFLPVFITCISHSSLFLKLVTLGLINGVEFVNLTVILPYFPIINKTLP